MKTIKALEKRRARLPKQIALIDGAIDLLTRNNANITFIADIPATWPGQIPISTSGKNVYEACKNVWDLLFKKYSKCNGFVLFGKGIHVFIKLSGGNLLSLSKSDVNEMVRLYCKSNGLLLPKWEIINGKDIGIFRRTKNGKGMPNVHYA